MKHEMAPESLVDLKFIMANTGFGKTFIYGKIKKGELPLPMIIGGKARWEKRDVDKLNESLRSIAVPSQNIRMKEMAAISVEKRAKKSPRPRRNG